jgi:LuxR family maltose regulon positive regulatory protein
LLQGEIDKAINWYHQEGKYDPDDLRELNEIKGITQARVMLAMGHLTDSLELLDRVLVNAEKAGRLEHAIEIRIIKTQINEMLGDNEKAQIHLSTALEMASVHGFVRIFLDERPALEPLISKLIHSGPTGVESGVSISYIHEVLSGFGEKSPTKVQTLVEELSPRELEILELISIGLSNKEISDRLFLSINTIKGYNHTIFGKLGVQNRTEAANRARDLGII